MGAENFAQGLNLEEYPEPLNAKERDLNIFIYDRLNTVAIEGRRGEVFEGNTLGYKIYVYIHNAVSDEETDKRPVSPFVFDSSHVVLSHETHASHIYYRFDDIGRAIKDVHRKDSISDKRGVFSRLDSGDYNDVNNALRLIKSGQYKVARKS